MIRWLSAAELNEHLRGYPPIGLSLRDWFHARTDIDPRSTLDVPPEQHFDEGLGQVDVWGGLVDAMPFAIRSMRDPHGGLGFEVMFPVRRDGDRALLDALAQLQSRLPPWRNPYFEQLPLSDGFGVVGGADDTALYTSAAREDAEAVAAFLSHAKPATSVFRVVPVTASTPGWLVVGPDTGPYIARLETASSEEVARRRAARLAAETGATFQVQSHL